MHIKPKKKLGQNFLIDKNILGKIVSAACLSQEDVVLEIGAGKGELTSSIIGLAKKVYAVEIDWRLHAELERGLKGSANLEVIKSDILKFDFFKLVDEAGIKQKIKVMGNIPYYISSPIIERLIEWRSYISVAFLTVQKEFARRVVSSAGNKDYGALSCFVQYYAKPEIVFDIKPSCFRPIPKVDSSLLSLQFFDQPPIQIEDPQGLFRIIRAAFNQRRKTLRNSLSKIISPGLLEEILAELEIDKNTRPERIGLAQFAKIYKKILDKNDNLI